MTRWILYYDSRYVDETIREMLDLARDIPFIEIVDTADMSDEDRNKIYFDIIMPISVFAGIKVRGRIRTHKAGAVWFINGVLVRSEDNPGRGGVWIGKEALEVLRKVHKNHSK